MRLTGLGFVLSLVVLGACGGTTAARIPDDAGSTDSSGSSSGSGSNSSSGSGSGSSSGSGSGSSSGSGSGSGSSSSSGSGSGASSSSGSGSSSSSSGSGSGRDGGLACFTGAQIPPSYKFCSTDTDCVAKLHQTDCCGSATWLGVAIAALADYNRCEKIWDSHFPACGCAARQPIAEDGNPVGADPIVQCVQTQSSNMLLCLTRAP